MSRHRWFLLVGLLAALLLAGVVSFYASSAPDGLEKVAADKGVDAQARDHALADSPLADYDTRGVDNARLSGAMAGVAGVVVTFAVGGVLFLALGRRRRTDREAAGGPADSQSPDARR